MPRHCTKKKKFSYVEMKDARFVHACQCFGSRGADNGNLYAKHCRVKMKEKKKLEANIDLEKFMNLFSY